MRALLLTLLLTGCGCVSVPSHDAVMATTHRIDVRVPEGVTTCSATAIGPDRLLTAEHCVDRLLEMLVDGERVTVASVVSSKGNDRATVTLSAPRFTAWAQMGPTPKQGDRVRWWGNPRGVANVYREAVVSAVQGDVVAVDAMVCHGDSGAGVFNDAGQVVAVMSRLFMPDKMAPCVFGLARK